MRAISIAPFALASLLVAGCASTTEDASTNTTTPAASSASATAEPTAKPAPTLVSGQEMVLAGEERTTYEAGEHVPANEQHPALNVPEPVMPELAKEQSFEGAKAFIEYWNQTRNYATDAGDATYTRLIVDDDFTSENDVYAYNEGVYAEDGWLFGFHDHTEVAMNDFEVVYEDLYDIIVHTTRDAGGEVSAAGEVMGTLEAFNSRLEPTRITLKWTGSGWQAYSESGIEGIPYG